MIRNDHCSTSLIFKKTPMSSPNSFNQAASNAQRPVEANKTNSSDPVFSRIISAKDKRITVVSADGTRVINENESFLDELAYHMDGPLKLYSNEYVENYNSFTYFGQPTTITYEDARSRVICMKMSSRGTPIVSKVFPFFISKSCSDPRTMVFNIKDMCYTIRPGENFAEPPVDIIRKALATLVSDFRRFTSNENDMMSPTHRQNAKIVNNYNEFPFSKVIISGSQFKLPDAKLFLSDSIIKSYNVRQIEEILMELLQFVEACGNGKQLSHFENFEVEVSIMTLSNGPQEYHFHLGKNYNMSADQRSKLEFSVEHALRDIVLNGYSCLNAHPFDLCRGVVMVTLIQNFRLVTTSEEEEENNFSRSMGQPPPYSQ